MQHYLIIGASSGIGKELARQLAESGKQVIATYNKNSPTAENPNIGFHQLNVLEDSISLDFLPDELAGFVYCPGSINLRPFERIKPADFESDYKLQVMGAIKLLQIVLPRLKKSANASIVLFSSVPGQVAIAALIGLFLPIFVIVGLFVTIVGAPLAVTLLVGVLPVVAFLGYLVAGIWIGDFVLERTSSGGHRGRPYLAAVVGLVILQVSVIFPPIPMIASFFGYGAVILLAWRVFRHEGSREAVAMPGAASPMPG